MSDNTTNSSPTGIILSGGSGSRVNRQDKGWIEWRGKALIEHCIESLTPQVADIIISCNRHHDRYEKLGHTICHDKRPIYQGPMAGIEAALIQCETDLAFIFPVDSAIVPADLVSTLCTALEDNNADIAYLNQPHKPQYLMAVMRQSLQQSVTDYLDNGGRAVREWYQNHNAIAVDIDYPDDTILNLNTPEALGQ